MDIGKNVTDAMDNVIKVMKCVSRGVANAQNLKLPKFSDGDKLWIKGELDMINHGLRDDQGKFTRFHVEYRISQCMQMKSENMIYKLGLTSDFIDLMKSTYAIVVYELLRELPELKKFYHDRMFIYERTKETYDYYREFFF